MRGLTLRTRRQEVGYNQAYSAYRTTSVKTASQGKLIIMLYDECVRQLTSALEKIGEDNKIQPQNIEKFNANVLKAQEVITELEVSLDMDAGGDIAKNLLNLYMFFNQELLDANVSSKREKIVFVKDMMIQLRETWAEIIASSAASFRAPVQGVNISG